MDRGKGHLSARVTLGLVVVFVVAVGVELLIPADDGAHTSQTGAAAFQLAVRSACDSRTSGAESEAWCRRVYNLVWAIPIRGRHARDEEQPVVDQRSIDLIEAATALRSIVLLVCVAAFIPWLLSHTAARVAGSHLQASRREATAMAGIFVRTLFVWGLAQVVGGVGPALSRGLGVIGALSGVFGVLALIALCKRHLGSRPKLSFEPGVSANSLLVLQLLGLVLLGNVALSLILPGGGVPEFSNRGHEVLEWVRLGLETVLIAPFLEELLFRWLLYSALRTRLTPLLAAGASSLAFALGHGSSIFNLVSAIWFGLVMALSFERSGKTGPLVVAHALYNLHTILSLSVTGAIQ
jgi:membrane protease YdiL (CAAX protease family)